MNTHRNDIVKICR